METYNLVDPDSNVMELLHCLEKSGSVRLTNLVRVEILDGLVDAASLQKAVVKNAVTRPDNNSFHCPKCGMAQRKSKHGDLCWRCQKKADEINKSHAPVDDPQPVRSQEVEPMFAASAGVRVNSDGHIGARKLG